MKAAIYCRRSTDEQDASRPDQEREARKYCRQEEWSVDDEHVHPESASGCKPGTPRPELERMMAAAARGEFEVLVGSGD